MNIGKAGATEIDFVACNRDNVYYFQVTTSMVEDTTFGQELAPLKAVNDNYPNIIALDHYTPAIMRAPRSSMPLTGCWASKPHELLFFVYSITNPAHRNFFP